MVITGSRRASVPVGVEVMDSAGGGGRSVRVQDDRCQYQSFKIRVCRVAKRTKVSLATNTPPSYKVMQGR